MIGIRSQIYWLENPQTQQQFRAIMLISATFNNMLADSS